MLDYTININLFFAFFWIIAGITALFLFGLNRKNILSVKETLLIVTLFIMFAFLESKDKEYYYYLTESFVSPFAVDIAASLMLLVVRVFPLFIFLFIFYKFRITPQNIEVDSNEIIEKLFNQGGFLNAFTTSVPEGKEDKEYGLDYIPFMLTSIIERRNRFKNEAGFWLISTGVIGFIFIFAVLYYSNVLLNDKYTGLPKVADNLVHEIRKINEITTNEYGIQDLSYYTSAGVDINFLSKISSKLKPDLQDSVLNFYNAFEKDKNLASFESHILSKIDQIKKQLPNEEKKLLFELEKINQLLQTKEYNLKTLPQITRRVENLSNQLEKKIEEPQNKIDELIKRLILSFIVISFLLAILRFVAAQYKSNYLEMIKAENEDTFVRKLYVGLKSARNDSENSKIVISSMLNYKNEESNKANLSSDEVGILKTIIESILSKIKGQ